MTRGDGGRATIAIAAALTGGAGLLWFITDASDRAPMGHALAVALQLCASMLAMAWLAWRVLHQRTEG